LQIFQRELREWANNANFKNKVRFSGVELWTWTFTSMWSSQIAAHVGNLPL